MGAVLRGVLAALALAVVGVLTALPVVAMHQRWCGLTVGLLAPVAFLAALPAGAARVGYVAGWSAVVGVLTGTRPEGDYLVPATVPGYVLLVATAAFVVVALVTIPARGGRDDPGSRGGRA